MPAMATTVMEEGNNLSSTSAINLDRLGHEDSGELQDLPPKTPSPPSKKRKRTSFVNPKRMTEKVNREIFNMLKAVPKIDELFSISDKIGEGTFSSVYRASLKQFLESGQEFALKHIIPTSHPDRILSELSCLVRIGGCDNVMGVNLTVRETDNIVIVMPYFKHSRFQDFYHDMSVEEVRDYMKNLFIALKRVHKFSVIHRDVKPGNFLYNREARKYALVDFGLAQGVPNRSKCKTPASTKSTVGGVLHHDTPRPTQQSKSRTTSASTNKAQSRTESKRSQSESRTAAPRLTELDPNTFNHSTDKSSRERSHNHALSPNDDLKKQGTIIIPRDSENIPDGTHAKKKEVAKTKPLILTRKCAAVGTRGGKKVQEAKSEAQGVCGCYGLPQVCDVCMARKNQVAPRAGTPGFRSPEVLLKCPDQTTAVDMWAAGVIFLSILSGRYPFFRAPDDVTALAQIMSIMGTKETIEAANANGKHLQCSVKLPAMDLMVMCRQLRFGATTTRGSEQRQSKRRHSRGGESSKRRRRSISHTPPSKDKVAERNGSPDSQKSVGSVGSEGQEEDQFPDSAYDLLKRLLELDPKKRISASEALRHPFLTEVL